MKKLTISLVMSLFMLLSACGQLEGNSLTFKTADPRLSIGLALLPAPPIPTIEPQLLPTVTPTPEPECINAKANISASNERIYHLPGDANYNTVKIDKDGEAIYCTAAEAEAAGFRRAQR